MKNLKLSKTERNKQKNFIGFPINNTSPEKEDKTLRTKERKMTQMHPTIFLSI